MTTNNPFTQSSILIVTKNRAGLLWKCLTSLSGQRYDPKEIIVVDNNSTDNTNRVISAFAATLPLKSYKTAVSGYPSIYNFGIRRATGKWIIFFDDDCIATENWSVSMNNAIIRAPGCVIQGKIVSIPRGNIYADIMGDHYRNWITSNMTGSRTMRTFDNKNLCVPAQIVKSFGMFNEDLVFGSEDIELGIRYRTHGVTIIHDPEVVAYHEERTTLLGFVNQHRRIARSESLLDLRLSEEEKLGVAGARKMRLHLKSAGKREMQYIRSGNIAAASLLPVLYAVLAAIRFWTYYTSVWNRGKSES